MGRLTHTHTHTKARISMQNDTEQTWQRGRTSGRPVWRGGDSQGDSGCLDRWSLSNRRGSKNMAAGLQIRLKHAHTHTYTHTDSHGHNQAPSQRDCVDFWKRPIPAVHGNHGVSSIGVSREAVWILLGSRETTRLLMFRTSNQPVDASSNIILIVVVSLRNLNTVPKGKHGSAHLFTSTIP